MTLRILGLGTALPECQMSQDAALELTHTICCADERQRRLASMLFRRSGVEQRRTAVPHSIAYGYVPAEPGAARSQGPTTGERMRLYTQHAPALAAQACRPALAAAGVAAADVTHLITVSCTGFDAPGVDIALFDSLRLRPTAERVQVGYMGCHGAINGLRVARGLAAQHAEAVILLCACELCSLHYRFSWDDEGVVGNALFADGAAALVMGSQPALGRGHWSVEATGSCLLPASRDAMSWRIGDHGFEMRLTPEVPRLIEEHLRPWLTDWLALHNLSPEQVAHWVIHPGGPRILDAAESALGLTREHTALSREVLARHGNMSSPTVLFVLDRLEHPELRGACVLLGFGPGLVAEACLLKRR
jgi:predicted naringenin-chalcone synthase